MGHSNIYRLFFCPAFLNIGLLFVICYVTDSLAFDVIALAVTHNMPLLSNILKTASLYCSGLLCVLCFPFIFIQLVNFKFIT
jgi:hypothetical protein